VQRVLLASDSSFADALASAVLQQTGPLLLVPSSLPIPGEVTAELQRLDPEEVVLLGGESAISEEVEVELRRLGFVTNRLSGPTRLDTAVEIARTRPNAVTALLVRAFDSSGGNGTGAWADSVAAGAFSAQNGLPILLTETDALSQPTREHLSASGVRTVIIIGGVSAVSAEVEAQLRADGLIVSRIAGATRFETALAIGQSRRLEDSDRAVLVDGVGDDGWQGGLSAARHAANREAPILPVSDAGIPESIQSYLDELQPTSYTCVEVLLAVCQGGGGEDGDGGSAVVTYNPPSGSAIRPDEVIVVGVDDPERTLNGDISVAASDCTVGGFERAPEYTAEAVANFSLSVAPEELGGDQPRPTGAVFVQPQPGDPFVPPQPGATAEPVEENEPTPVNYPTTCQVTTTLGTSTDESQVDTSAFNVVDLRPRIRLSTYPQVATDPISFTDMSGGPVETWFWEFGDGATSAEQHPTHTYSSPSCYEVDLTVGSSLRHWFDGRTFTDQVTRLVSVDPADPDEAHTEIYVVDGFEIAPDTDVDLFRLGRDEFFNPGAEGSDDVYVASARSGSDGVAVFPDVLANSGADGHAVYVFNVESRGKRTFQVLTPGQTLCPGLQLADVGDVAFTVTTSGDNPQAISGARISIPISGYGDLGDRTDPFGQFTARDLPVGTYAYEVSAPGFASVRGVFEINVDATTAVAVELLRPSG